jgi:hypothetical protein
MVEHRQASMLMCQSLSHLRLGNQGSTPVSQQHCALSCCQLRVGEGLLLSGCVDVALANALCAMMRWLTRCVLCCGVCCRFKFMVHPTGFLVHRQHSYSKAGSLYQASKKTYEKTIKEDKAKGAKDTSLAGTTHKYVSVCALPMHPVGSVAVVRLPLSCSAVA